ncbi:histone H1-like [Drosophila innubila]|uniref:histone H1-like n=1 Tax=Drosophila innubila TaxID=198719 RepID=UPI00148BC489|nr:histone H1-like [Drosophila innubila]
METDYSESAAEEETPAGSGQPHSSPKKRIPLKKLKSVKKKSIISLGMTAIEALSNRSGSSVRAIVKYIKSTDYEVTDEKRFSKHLFKALKAAVIKGDLKQVKFSFKLSETFKKTRAKMKKKLEKEKKKKAMATARRTAEKAKQSKKKASKRKSEVF